MRNLDGGYLMKKSKITVIGSLICLIAIFYHDAYWLTLEGLSGLPRLMRFVFPIGVVITLIGLFFSEDS